jgi:pullulanase
MERGASSRVAVSTSARATFVHCGVAAVLAAIAVIRRAEMTHCVLTIRRLVLAASAAALVAGCSPDAGGGRGSVQQPQPTTNTAGFDIDVTGTFVVGTAPETASFSSGLARSGKWIIRDGTTGAVVFASPPRQVAFDLEVPPLAAAQALEPALFDALSAGLATASDVSCGIPDGGLDNGEAFGGQLYLRGAFNDWAPRAEWGFINTGGGIYQLEQQFTAGDYQYKIAQAAWDQFDRAVLGEPTRPNVTYVVADPGPGGPNGTVAIPTDGCWRITLDANDTASITLRLEPVGGGGGGGGKTECGVGSQGLDDGEAFGGQLFMRGGFSDWNPLPDFAFYNFGEGIYQAEFELTGGAYQYKIAQAAWDQFDRTVAGQETVPGPTLPLTDPGPGGPNGNLVVPNSACWNFAIDARDIANLTLRVSEVDLSGGEGPGTFTGVEIRLLDPAGEAISTQQIALDEAGINQRVSYSRSGSDAPIGRIEIGSRGGAGDLFLDNFTWTVNPRDVASAVPLTIFYRRPDGNYADTQIVIGGQAFACTPTAFGCSATVQAVPNSTIAFTVRRAGVTDPTGTFTAVTGSPAENVYAFSGNPDAVTGNLEATPEPNEVLLFYQRDDGNYDGWAVHLFPTGSPDWTLFNPGNCLFQGVDPMFGAYFRITLPPNPCYDANPPPLTTFPAELGFIIHKGEEKDPGPDQFIRIAEQGNMVFVVSGIVSVDPAPPSGSRLSVTNRAAHWVDLDTLLWRPAADAATVELLWSEAGNIGAGVGGLTGDYQSVVLQPGSNPEPDNQRHLWNLPAWEIPAAVSANAKDLLRYQLVVLARDRFGVAIGATYVQTPGVLDDVYGAAATAVPLGLTWSGGTPTLRVWAPTADIDAGVTLTLYSDAAGTVAEQVAMTLDPATGVWSATGNTSWNRRYYDFTLRVWSYAAESFVTNRVTDPWSMALSADSRYSLVVNLDDPDTKPAGWDSLELPAVAAPEDIVLYELHMRDFSVTDPLVPEQLKGRYGAFALNGTAGTNQLEALAGAGLTHVHLLPVFDIATVQERREDRVELDDPVAELCVANPAAAGLCPTHSGKTIRQLLQEITAVNPVSQEQQEIANLLRNLDGFNWGYDPWHFGVPEGSYATNPDGITRIVEFRQMVKGLADMGLRTVMDVVYNHTNEGGQGAKSVFDRIVPGYYHRYNETSGAIETSTCCPNTATEFVMMEKLMADTLLRFSADYKVGGFRFDLMGHQPKAAMVDIKGQLDSIDPGMYLYGEGWNFGEVANDRRFIQATQLNMAGTGIGTFSDRIRDAARGGGPFDSGAAHVVNQGFISGGGYDPNAANRPPTDAFVTRALTAADQLRATMAGSIRTFTFENSSGEIVTGADISYNGAPTAYVEDPSEIINYVEAHDNETMWDVSQYKHPAALSAADRVRAQNLGSSIVLLAQGIPFIHAGQELLRSKSLDRDSYDHTDWFNKLDYTFQDNNWARGLPDREKNQGSWPQITTALQNANSVVAPAQIQFANQHFQEMLRIRSSTVLFRLREASDINARVSFWNTGPAQRLGVIAKGIDGCSDGNYSPEFGYVMAILNANDEPQSLDFGGSFAGQDFDLHPIQQVSVDAVVQSSNFDTATGVFFVPARTAAVFVREEQVSCSPFGVDVFVRGLNGDWSDAPANLLPFEGGTLYQGVFQVNAGGQDFKVASSDWATVNCGGDGSTAVTLDQPYALVCGDNTPNLSFNAPATGPYQFSVDATDPGNPVLTIREPPPYAVDIFVRGGFNGWADPPPPDSRLDFVGNDQYRGVINIPDPSVSGNRTFKIASGDWSAVNCGGDGSNLVVPGQPYTLECGSNPENAQLDISQAGLYAFLLDAANPASPVLTVEKTPFDVTVFVRGLNGDWSESQPMSYAGSGQYERAITLLGLSGDDRNFKIASSDWSTVNCGGSQDVVPSASYPLSCGGDPPNLNLATDATGRYLFRLDANQPATPTLTVTGPGP